MTQEQTPIEMTIEGEFVRPMPEGKPPLGTRVLVWAAVIAALAGAGVVAVFAIWLLAILIPIALLAAVLAYAAFRYHLWRSGGSVQTLSFRWPPRR